MLAVQNGHVALRIVVFVHFGHLRWRGFGLRQRPQLAIAHPSALLASRGVNVEQPHRLAIPLELILNVTFERERLGMGEIDAGVIQVLAVEDADGNEARGLGMGFIAGPLVHRDRAQVGRVRVRLGDLAGILCGRGRRENQRGRREQRGCLYPQAAFTVQ